MPGKFPLAALRIGAVVTILTTPGATFFTTGAKLPRGRVSRGTGVSASGTSTESADALASLVDCWVKAKVDPANTTAPAKLSAAHRLLRKFKSDFITVLISVT